MVNPQSIVVIDTETSHWNPTKGLRILQVAAVSPFAELCESSYLLPDNFDFSAMRPEVMGINHITPDLLREKGDPDAILLMDLVEKIVEGEITPAGHNWPFDRKAIEAEMAARGVEIDLSQVPFIDTLRVIREIYDNDDEFPDFKLGTCFYKLTPETDWKISGVSHDALFDCRMTAALLRSLHTNIGLTLEDMVVISGELFVPRVCPMGNQKGKPWNKVDRGFLEWMVKNRVWLNDEGVSDEGLETAILTEAISRGLF